MGQGWGSDPIPQCHSVGDGMQENNWYASKGPYVVRIGEVKGEPALIQMFVNL